MLPYPAFEHLTRALASDERGTVHAEYVIVLSLVAVGVAAATVLAGALLFQVFLYQERLLLLPVP
jgi:Flp pilus assembly pilin Flp